MFKSPLESVSLTGKPIIYRATILEDIANLPRFDLEKAEGMNDAEVEALLDKTNGILP